MEKETYKIVKSVVDQLIEKGKFPNGMSREDKNYFIEESLTILQENEDYETCKKLLEYKDN